MSQGCSHFEIVVDSWSAPSLFSWRSTRGAVGNLFLSFCHQMRVLANLFWSSCQHLRAIAKLLNCCHHVRVVFCLWAAEMTKVLRKVPHFGAGIVWRTIPSDLPVFWITVPGCSRDGYGTSPNLWVQKKLVKFWQGTQVTWIFFAKLFWELNYSVFDILRDLGDVILS